MSQSAGQTPSPSPPIPGRRTFFQWLTYEPAAWPQRSWVFRSSAICWGPCGSTGSIGSGWDAKPIPTQRDPTGDVPKSTGPAVGWHGSPYGRIRPQLGTGRKATGSVPGVRHELRSPGLPCDLVSAVWSLHVSVPRRRLLRERRAGFGAAGARPVPLRLADSRRTTGNPGAPPADVAEHLGRIDESLRTCDEANSGMVGSALEPAR